VPDNGCDIVVVGASAGGVEALSAFARALPPDFAVPVLVVLHVPATGTSVLPDILSRAGALPARHPVDGERLRGGYIYVAPPNCHLLIADGAVELSRGPRENGHRPAIDPLFRSAAAAYDGRTAGVVLSGTLDDGAAGLFVIKAHGGATLVQDPEEALYTSMPANAIRYVAPDYVLRMTELVDVLVRLTANSHTSLGTGEEKEEDPVDQAAPAPGAEQAQPGDLAPFSCPDCGGSLWAISQGGLETFRCRVGHAFSLNSLAARHGDAVDRALWTAYRALEERAAMSRRVARRLTDRERHDSAARFEAQAVESMRQAEVLKRVLDEVEATPDAGAAEENEER
jgi:two-component system chemotaxis response regulator CheB